MTGFTLNHDTNCQYAIDVSALTLMIINLSDTKQKVPLRVDGITLNEAETWLLDASHNAENLGKQPIPADGVLTLPAQSATLYVIK